MLNQNAFDIEKIVHELYGQGKIGGILIEGGLNEDAANALLDEARAANFHGPRRYVDVSKDMQLFYLGEVNEKNKNPNFPLAYRLRDEFFGIYSLIGERANFRAKSLNSIGIHKFEDKTQGILPHIDDARYSNLIASFCLSGNSTFYFYSDEKGESRGPNDLSFRTGKGSVVLLRAPRNESELDLRPWHSVDDIDGDRYSIVIRENSRGQK